MIPFGLLLVHVKGRSESVAVFLWEIKCKKKIDRFCSQQTSPRSCRKQKKWSDNIQESDDLFCAQETSQKCILDARDRPWVDCNTFIWGENLSLERISLDFESLVQFALMKFPLAIICKTTRHVRFLKHLLEFLRKSLQKYFQRESRPCGSTRISFVKWKNVQESVLLTASTEQTLFEILFLVQNDQTFFFWFEGVCGDQYKLRK